MLKQTELHSLAPEFGTFTLLHECHTGGKLYRGANIKAIYNIELF